jgi:hypothetical protein
MVIDLVLFFFVDKFYVNDEKKNLIDFEYFKFINDLWFKNPNRN